MTFEDAQKVAKAFNKAEKYRRENIYGTGPMDLGFISFELSKQFPMFIWGTSLDGSEITVEVNQDYGNN